MANNYNQIVADYDGQIRAEETYIYLLELQFKKLEKRIAKGKEMLGLMKYNREHFAKLIAADSPNHFESELSPFVKGLTLHHTELQNTANLKHVDQPTTGLSVNGSPVPLPTPSDIIDVKLCGNTVTGIPIPNFYDLEGIERSKLRNLGRDGYPV